MLGSAIKNLVVVKMEEYTPYGPTPNAPLLANGDVVSQVKPIESYIDQMLAEAANEMLLLVPLHVADTKTDNVTAVVDSDDNRIGTIAMPSDYLRLHTLQMAGWEKLVHEVVHEDSPLYALQHKYWTRGTKQKPVVTESKHGELHYYSVDSASEHEVAAFKYVARFDGNTDYKDRIAELIALQCARKIYEVYGNTEQVGVMTNEINSVLENLRQ